jgi:hypothetical protein
MSGPDVAAIVTAMDNCPLLRVSVPILLQDPLISRVIVVNQGSVDDTAEYLATQPVIAINKENDGAGPGRNRGIEAAWPFDYAFFLDGGMRPLLPGIRVMLDFLERRADVDVLGLEWSGLETDIAKAWRRWPYTEIRDDMSYPYSMVSLTNYCLARARAWENGLRFEERGPWGEPGWGADDDEMAYQWRRAGIVVHALSEARAYRRGSGSFRRLFRETGIWPNQYGSTYEKRCVWLAHEWPDMQPGIQWGEPWLTVVVQAGDVDETARIIKGAHDGLRQWHLDGRWRHIPQPYSVVLWNPGPEVEAWAEPRRLRQHHGDTIIVDGQIVRRNAANEATWTGDFRVWRGDDPAGAVRADAKYWTLVTSIGDLEQLLGYWRRFPQETANVAPGVRRERVLYRG